MRSSGSAMFRLALYGKGGIGKSTTACNLAASLAKLGYRVVQIGCDPKADSTRLTMRGLQIPTVLDQMRALGDAITLEDVVFEAPNGVLCAEAGGPIPGVGCAGRGVIAAFELLEELNAYEKLKPDFVIYDVLGDVVCGGFAMPMRGQYTDAVMIVSSGEMMSLYAASNIIHALDSFKKRGYARFEGIIANLRYVANEKTRIAEFCEEEGAFVQEWIPRSPLFQQAEDAFAPLVDYLPNSDEATLYMNLARVLERLAASRNF